MEIVKVPISSVVYFEGKKYHFVGFDGNDAIIRLESSLYEKRVPPETLAWFRKGGFIPLQNTIGQGNTIFSGTRAKKRKIQQQTQTSYKRIAPAVNLKDTSYLQRKQRQNNELLHDISTFLNKEWLSTVRVLALDDFCSEKKQRLNTYKNYFSVYGGRHSNFYLCNPNMEVFRNIYAQGGHGIPLKVGDCLSNKEIRLPPMDVFYLDYTCKWKTAKKDIETLFQESYRLFRPRGVILHITLSKMFDQKSEYENIMRDIIEYIQELGSKYGYDIIPTRTPYVSKTMFKIAVFIRPMKSN